MTVFTNLDVFFEKVRRGGGVISDPKNFIADLFVFKTGYFGCKFLKKCPKRGERGGVISSPKKIIANLRIFTNFREKAQCNLSFSVHCQAVIAVTQSTLSLDLEGKEVQKVHRSEYYRLFQKFNTRQRQELNF